MHIRIYKSLLWSAATHLILRHLFKKRLRDTWKTKKKEEKLEFL